MQRAARARLVGVVGGVLGCWIVLYELYSAESLAHSLFPLVLAALLGFPLVLGGAIGVLAAAAAVAARVPGRARHVGRVASPTLRLGVLLRLTPATPPGLSLLFGDLLGVSRGTVTAGALTGVVLLALALLHRQLLAVGFDRTTARALGGRPLFTDLSLLALIAAATLIAVRGLGNLLVVAALVAPAAAARLLTSRVVPMMVFAAALAVCCGVGGLYLSYYAGTAGGASVAGLYVLAYLVARFARFSGRDSPSSNVARGLALGPRRGESA